MDGQGGYYDGREKREENYSYQQQPQQQLQQQQQQPQQQHQQHQPSPPHSASPFAFAPPPLSSSTGQQHQQQQRPAPLTHQQHSEPLPSVQYQTSYYTPRPAQPVHASSFPASAPMGGYRSYSNESAPARNSPPPQNAPMSRTTSMTYNQPQAQAPPQPQHSHSYNSSYRSPPAAYASASTRPSPYGHPSYYPQQYQPVGTPGSVEMPRSVSYPNYSQGYPASYMPGQPYASHHPSLPPLLRHTSTSTIGEGVGGMDINRSNMGYSFGHRLPLVDRPFKCDECVQSFNRNHDLKRHKRIHLAVKPFGCDKCGKTFSRKDALRRHWLVKGCRGEDGATAPIMPLFPINAQAPALSPPTPPGNGNSSPTEQTPFTTGPLSFSHPAAPPPLSTLPPRQHNESTTSLLVTPHEIPPASTPAIISLDEAQPIVQRTSQSSNESYFEAAQNMPGGSMMEKSRSSGSHASPYSRYPASANQYRQSPGRNDSVSGPGPYQRVVPSTMNVDSKPVFAAPFNGPYESNGMLAPDGSIGMEKQLSQMSAASADGETPAWQPRWHRPSFPFPPPAGSNYNYEPPSPADMPHGQAQQTYA